MKHISECIKKNMEEINSGVVKINKPNCFGKPGLTEDQNKYCSKCAFETECFEFEFENTDI